MKSTFILLCFLLNGFNGYCQEENPDSISFGNYHQTVYTGCTNKLKIVYPHFSVKDTITYEIEGGEFGVDKDSNNTIFADIHSVRPVLKIFKNGKIIGETTLRVRLIPKPKIRLYIGNSELTSVNDDYTISKEIKYITVKAIPDSLFKARLPLEANYRIVSWTAYLMRGELFVDSIKFNHARGDLSRLMFNAEKGNEIYIEISEVVRYS
ncbi:MAG TPA: hypothetical protein VNW06_07105, partial [Cytophagaceae bacterium]|nr:hypothetical protein [Cytophagaceae bacterium]